MPESDSEVGCGMYGWVGPCMYGCTNGCMVVCTCAEERDSDLEWTRHKLARERKKRKQCSEKEEFVNRRANTYTTTSEPAHHK